MKIISFYSCLLAILIVFSCTSENISTEEYKVIDQVYADFPVPLGTHYVDEYEGIGYTLPDGFSVISSKSKDQVIAQRAGPDIRIHCVCVEGQAFCELVLPNKCFREVDCITCQVTIYTKYNKVVSGNGNETLFIKKEGKSKIHPAYKFLDKHEPLKTFASIENLVDSKSLVAEIKKKYTSDRTTLVKVPININGVKTIVDLDLESLIASGESFMYLLYEE